MIEAETTAVMIPAWTVGDRIRKARMVLGLERADLIQKDASGKLSVWQITNYERDIATPKDQVLDKLAELLKISKTWLLTGENPVDPQGPGGGVPSSVGEFARRVANKTARGGFNSDTPKMNRGFGGDYGSEPTVGDGVPLRRAA